MRFVENDEVVRKQVTGLALELFFRAAQEHEEQGVIDHDHVRRQQSFPRLLEKTLRRLPAGFAGANVGLTANLRPDFRVRLDGQIAQGSVSRRPRPFDDARQLRRFRSREQLARLLERAVQPTRTKIILPAFHERRLEFDRQDFLQDRDVLVQ